MRIATLTTVATAALLLAFAAPARAFLPKIPISECREGGSVPARSCECADMPKVELLIYVAEANQDAWAAVQQRNPRCMAEAKMWYAQNSTSHSTIISDLKACPDYEPIPEPNECSSNSDCGSHGACYPTGGGSGETDVCNPTSSTSTSGAMACAELFELGKWDDDEDAPVVDPCYCQQMCSDIVEGTGVHEERHHWDYTWGLATSAVKSLSVYLEPPGEPIQPGPMRSIDQINANIMMGSEINARADQAAHLQKAMDDYMATPEGQTCTWESIVPALAAPVPQVDGFVDRVRLLLDRMVNGAEQ